VRKRKKRIRIIPKIIIVLVVFIGAGFFGFSTFRTMGKSTIYQNAETVEPDLALSSKVEYVERSQAETSNWQEGDIRYENEIYRYNEDILTFLVLGVDKTDKINRNAVVKDYTAGGQSDTLFLLILNPHNKKISLIGINRDAMTNINMCDKDGVYTGEAFAQITLQHAYGDGMEESCNKTVTAVSNMFYQLPIHGYCALNMGAIPIINDAVGGVEVTVLEKIPDGSSAIRNHVGETVLLSGMDAYWYVRDRDCDTFESANLRLNRQKQYIDGFIERARVKTKENISFPIILYEDLIDYMVTNVTASEISYLAPEIVNYTFDTDDLYSLPGETKMGETFEEFYVDDDALYDLIIQLFYEKVE